MATRTIRAWYIDKLGKMGIVEKATNVATKNGYVTDWISVASVLPVRLYAISRDSDISVNELTNTFNQIPGEYHEALVYKVIAMGYKDPRQMDIKIAQYFDNEYMIAVKQGKKFSKSNYTDLGYVVPQDF